MHGRPVARWPGSGSWPASPEAAGRAASRCAPLGRFPQGPCGGRWRRALVGGVLPGSARLSRALSGWAPGAPSRASTFLSGRFQCAPFRWKPALAPQTQASPWTLLFKLPSRLPRAVHLGAGWVPGCPTDSASTGAATCSRISTPFQRSGVGGRALRALVRGLRRLRSACCRRSAPSSGCAVGADQHLPGAPRLLTGLRRLRSACCRRSAPSFGCAVGADQHLPGAPRLLAGPRRLRSACCRRSAPSPGCVGA